MNKKVKSHKEIIIDNYFKDLKTLLSKKGSSVFWMALGGLIITTFSVYIATILVRFVETIFGQTTLFWSIFIAFIFMLLGYGFMRKGWEDWKR